MKHFLLLLFLFPALVFAQPKITDIMWKGPNNECIQFFKKDALYIKGAHYQWFGALIHKKNSYILLSSQHIKGIFVQRYDIVRLTPDILILQPDGRDVFRLSKPNEENQYVFVNSLHGFSFKKLHFSTSIIAPSLDLNLHITLTLDSLGSSRIKLHDDYMNQTNVVTFPMTKAEYKQLILLLSAVDLDNLIDKSSGIPQGVTSFEAVHLRSVPRVLINANSGNTECSNSHFEIHYNNQIKISKGCAIVPFYLPVLENFIWDYITNKTVMSGRNPILY